MRRLVYNEDGERGAYAILFAILLIAMISFVALVVDMGQARAQRRSNQSVADSAALVAGPELADNSPRDACASAFLYVKANLPLPASATFPCDQFPETCIDPDVAIVKEQIYGEYLVRITNPVPDSLIAPARLEDGDDPCKRMKVDIIRTSDNWFAGVMGFSDRTVFASATVRGILGTEVGELVALLLLDPVACNVLTVGSGNTAVRVLANEDKPGRITIDSSGTGGSGSNRCLPGQDANRWTIDSNDTPTLDKITADPGNTGEPGVIELFAMQPGQATCLPGTANHACDPLDVSSGRVDPQPVRLEGRTTRGPIDYAFNCRTGYPDFDGIVPIADCPDEANEEPHIDRLRLMINGPGGSLSNAAPPGFERWTTSTLVPLPPGGGRCSPSSVTVPLGFNWWIDCPGGFNVGGSNVVTFLGGNLVFQGDVSIGTQATLSINTVGNQATFGPDSVCQDSFQQSSCYQQSSALASYVFIRGNGTLSKGAQASLLMRNTVVYINNGSINLGGGGSGSLVWIAPFEGPLEDLTLWSEGSGLHGLGGAAGLGVEGVFFMPNARFSFNGQGLQNQTKAQFIAYRLNADGQGTLFMQPDPDRVVLIPKFEGQLIR